MSVSGYMRAPLGRGLIAVVVPSSGAPFLITTLRTSPGILWNALLARNSTDSRANSACHFGATHKIKASESDNCNSFLTTSTSSEVIPYAGSSSEWKIPATPACLAELASSRPSRGICAPFSSNSLVPIFPAKPCNFNPRTTEPIESAFTTISELLFTNKFVSSSVLNGNLEEAERATLFSTGIESKRRSGGRRGNSNSLRNSLAKRYMCNCLAISILII